MPVASPFTVKAYRVLVAGGGPVGLTAALALARAGVEVTLVTPKPQPRSNAAQTGRTVALFEPSMRLLRNLGLADRLTANPIAGIRLIDDLGGLLRAPEVTFRASDIGRDAFGHNIANAELEAALREALAGQRTHLDWIDGAAVLSLDIDETSVTVRLDDGRALEAAVVVACDGRNSPCRASAGIEAKVHHYAQSAVTATFTHTRAHGAISTEFHRVAGPCTTVPLPGNASSLVWVECPERAAAIAALDDAAFIASLEERLQGLLGTLRQVSPRGLFPLQWIKAATAASRRVMLAGEAAHVMPPIGAQGLNLGLRDAAAVVDCIFEAASTGADPGAESVLEAYRRARSFDIATRMTAIDALNRSLLSDLVPVHLARSLSLHAVRAFPLLRRQLIAAGINPPGSLPRLMQQHAHAS